MVRSARYLEIIEEDGLVENARTVGERLLAGLVEVQGELGGKMSNARGPRADDRLRPADAARCAAAPRDALLANGLLVLGCGPRSIRFRPALDLAAAEADAAIEIVRRTREGALER